MNSFNAEHFEGGKATYLEAAEQLQEQLDQIETELADNTKQKDVLEKKKEEILKEIEIEKQSRLN